MRRLLGKLLARYLEAVWSTGSVVFLGEERNDTSDGTPHIIAAWHGQHFLAPFVRRQDQEFWVLVARGPFGSVYTHTFSYLGLNVLRGSTGRDIRRSGSLRALRQMLQILRDGGSIAITVDIPKAARVAGAGVVTLARHSGRAIVPLAVVSSRRVALKWRWDKPTINLPFSRIAFAFGKPIFVSQFGDDRYFENKRLEVERALNAANERAIAVVDQVD